MARARTLNEIIAEVRQRSDMVNSDFVTDAELTRYINESISELYDMLIAAKGQEWFIREYTLTTLVNQDAYEIPEAEDFYILLGVDLNNSGSETPTPLRPYMLDERHDRLHYDARPYLYQNSTNLRYRLSGTVKATAPGIGTYNHRITFKPSPPAGLSITLLYIPHAPVLVTGATDKWDGFNGWEEYVVVDSAIKCLEKEESSTIALERRKERLIQRINGLASAHDDGFPERVTDVTGRIVNYPYDV